MRTRHIHMMALILAIYAHAPHANAGHLSGRVTANAPSAADQCDSLGVVQAVPHRVHARIMAGTVRVWEDSIACQPGDAWDLYYADLAPGAYQASSWTTKASNDMLGCPDVIAIVVEARYKIIFGWTTVGAVYDNQSGKVIGAAEMLRRLNECEQGGP